jgi:transcription elongation factor Elf1
MAIEFNCPHCQHPYRLKDELAGKTATCKTCRHKIDIPRPLTAEELAAKEAAAVAALTDEPAQAVATEQDDRGRVPALQPQVDRAAGPGRKNTLCPNPECRQRVKIPELKKDQVGNWREAQTRLPSLAKQHAEKLEGVVAAGDAQMVSGETLRKTGVIVEELEPRSLKRMAMFGFVILALVGGLIYGRVADRRGGENTKIELVRSSIKEFGETTAALPPSEAPSEVQLVCSSARNGRR